MQKTPDFGEVSNAHMAVARLYSSPSLSGPPVCDELVSLVQYMLTDEEADVLQHLKPLRAKKAGALARASGRSYADTRRILEQLANEKYIILGVGKGDRTRYSLMPIVPGTFEYVLMRPSEDMLSEWHRGFSKRFEALFSTGYMADYQEKPTRMVRYLPVGEVIDALPMALPSDRLEDILDRYDKFAIGICQCRTSKKLIGEGCGKPLEVCTAFGDIAGWLADMDKMKAASKQDVLEAKRAAEAEGCVTWMFNVGTESKYNGSCSCCGCCCGALRTVVDFNAPGFIAPPHFMPTFDLSQCVYCEKCSKVCPMKAVAVTGGKDDGSLHHQPERCIGCGLCAVACKKSAISMRELAGYDEPPSGWPTYALKYLPSTLSNMRSVHTSRK